MCYFALRISFQTYNDKTGLVPAGTCRLYNAAFTSMQRQGRVPAGVAFTNSIQVIPNSDQNLLIKNNTKYNAKTLKYDCNTFYMYPSVAFGLGLGVKISQY